MFNVKVICFYLVIYAVLFLTGLGFSSLLCQGKNEQFRYLLAPIFGIIIFSISPIYFSILGINTSIAGWVIFPLCGCYSIYSLVKRFPTAKEIRADSLILPLAILLAVIPSLTVIMKAGYLTSTLESYSAFITIPADYLLNNTFNHTVAVEYNKPITNLLAEVVGNQEYFGPFFLLASLSAILGIPPYKLYLALSGILASFLPVSAFIAGVRGFSLQRRCALLLSLLVSINYSFFLWPMIGQMPMTGGMVYLILAIGFIPSFFEVEAKADYFLYSALLAGVLSMYWILIPYVVGIYLLYSFFRFMSYSIKSCALRTGVRLAIGSFIISPFTLIFLCLHGVEMVTTTSQFTKNIPRYPYLEEILGFGRHFSMAHDGTIVSILILGIACLSLLIIFIGCFVRFSKHDYLFITVFSIFLLLGCVFYLVDFTYHFYKNAVMSVFILLVALVTGVNWSLTRGQSITVRSSLVVLCLFAVLNVSTMVTFALAKHRIIDESLISLSKLTETIPSDSLILIDSFDPTREAWLSYFLKDRKIKIRGSVETWGFWILAPFSGKANPNFFFDPKSDSIDYTLSSRLLTSADIVRPKVQELIAANDDYVLTKGLSDPCLFKGWYPVEESSDGVYRWTKKESSILIGKSSQDYLVKITGNIPGYYDKLLEVQFRLNGDLVGLLESGPTHFTQKCLLTREAMSRMYNIFSINLDRTFCPDRIMNNADKRSLGITVNSIAFLPQELFSADNPIDIGNPEFDRYLMNGWSLNEVLQDNTTFRWVQGQEASFIIFLESTKNMKMEFRTLPFRYPNCPQQELTICINGNTVERIGLPNETWRVYNVDIPCNTLKKGLNRIDLIFQSSASPSKVLAGTDDVRSLSAAFDYIKFSPLPK